MHLYDTATRSTLAVVPRHGRIGLYVCGITPYDGGHVGHAFTYHTFDILTRHLRATGIEVRSVRNVTDVDDDILRVASVRGLDYLSFGRAETARFDRDMSDLGLLPVDAAPRATDHVPAMVEWVERLVEAGCAYSVDGWVFFETRALSAYGALSGLDRTSMVALSRLRGADPDDPRKRDPLDFVLWQRSRPGEPAWESPWSRGRPGWHIECTVLSTSELAVPIDIHGGGTDLIYPHHECELAQAHAAGVADYVRHWVHVAMVGYAGEKMSKSLGNLVFVRDLVDSEGAAVVRLLLSAHHHRSDWEYHSALLDAARERWQRYRAVIDGDARLSDADAGEFLDAVTNRIADDLDTPGALAILDALAEQASRQRTHGSVASAEVLTALLGTLGIAAAAVAA